MVAEVELSVRPRSSSGVVFLVWGGGDYLGVELFEGKVKANVNNGAGDIETSVAVPEICDGQWRKIRGEIFCIRISCLLVVLYKI